MLELRDYQREAIEKIRKSLRGGARRIMLVLATGGGKTIVASAMISSAVSKDKRVLFGAHRREILNQTYNKLITCGLPKEKLGVIMAKDPRRNPVAHVQIASVDTLRNRTKPPSDLVFIDECHRSLAKTYERILECYPSVPIIGMTASPWRADNKGFDQAYDDIVVVCTVAELISQGWLVKPTCFTIPKDQQADLSEVHVSGGDFNERELSVALNKRHLVGNIVEHWERMADGRRTVVFAASVEHSKGIVAAFVEAGHKAEHLDGEMDTVTRDAILARLDSGETLIVSSCGILSEGWDQPSVKCAILARPTMSLALCIQQVGRILRPWKGVGALILDHAGNIERHGLPDEDREYTLEATKKKKTAGGLRTKTCPVCYRMHPVSLARCPCGHEFTVERGDPETVDGTLVEYTLEDKKKEWERLTTIEAERGTPGWAFEMFKIKYKRAPPKEFRPISVPVHTEKDKTSYCRWLMHRAESEGKSMHWVKAVYRGKFSEEAPLEILREGRGSKQIELAEGQSEEPAAAQEAVEWIV